MIHQPDKDEIRLLVNLGRIFSGLLTRNGGVLLALVAMIGIIVLQYQYLSELVDAGQRQAAALETIALEDIKSLRERITRVEQAFLQHEIRLSLPVRPVGPVGPLEDE